MGLGSKLRNRCGCVRIPVAQQEPALDYQRGELTWIRLENALESCARFDGMARRPVKGRKTCVCGRCGFRVP